MKLQSKWMNLRLKSKHCSKLKKMKWTTICFKRKSKTLSLWRIWTNWIKTIDSHLIFQDQWLRTEILICQGNLHSLQRGQDTLINQWHQLPENQLIKRDLLLQSHRPRISLGESNRTLRYTSLKKVQCGTSWERISQESLLIYLKWNLKSLEMKSWNSLLEKSW